MKFIAKVVVLPLLGLLGLIFLSSNFAKNPYEKVLDTFQLSKRMEYYGVAGISFAIIKNGKLDWAKGYGALQKDSKEKVDTETVFSVGSISKVGTAVISLKMQEEGKLDIDSDVNDYLRSWKVPENEHTQKQAVSLRRIMSHTAGLTVHGFGDFGPKEKLPTTVQILEGKEPAKNAPIYVNIPVGSRFRYSGGGITVEQMLIEDITGKLFHIAAKQMLFEPLGMNRSSYENPLPVGHGNIAKAHNSKGKAVALPRGYQSMPEAAASGLWTTPSDFSKLIIMLMKASQGEGNYLSSKTIADMMTAVAPGNYGLGPRITSENGDTKFSHGGANDSYRAHFSALLDKQNGIVIFTNGTSGKKLINEILPHLEALLF